MNEGCFTPFDVRIPRGSLLNPTPPMPTGGRFFAMYAVIDAIVAALSEAVPELASATCLASLDVDGPVLSGTLGDMLTDVGVDVDLGGGSGSSAGSTSARRLTIVEADRAEAARARLGDPAHIVVLERLGDLACEAVIERGTANDLLPHPVTRQGLRQMLEAMAGGRAVARSRRAAAVSEVRPYPSARVLVADDSAVNTVIEESATMSSASASATQGFT